jgi:hypothetical protein
MGDNSIKYLRFRYTGGLEDLNAIKDSIEEILRKQGWSRGFSELAPLDSNPKIYGWATGWKRYEEPQKD